MELFPGVLRQHSGEQLYCLGKDFIVWGTTLFVANNSLFTNNKVLP